MFGRKAREIARLRADNARLREANTKLIQQMTVAAQWCPDKLCEFKHLKFDFPPVDEFVDNFLKYVERQEDAK